MFLLWTLSKNLKEYSEEFTKMSYDCSIKSSSIELWAPVLVEFTRMSYDSSIKSCFWLRVPVLVAGVPNIDLRSESSYLGLDRQIWRLEGKEEFKPDNMWGVYTHKLSNVSWLDFLAVKPILLDRTAVSVWQWIDNVADDLKICECAHSMWAQLPFITKWCR